MCYSIYYINNGIRWDSTVFIYNLKAVAKKLEIDYAEVTSHINHMGELGASREELLKSYIKQFLPEKFKVGRGIIVDSDERQSRQQDFIIYDAFNSPAALLMDSVQVLPIESVYCTIEVKSTLNKAELSKCVENIKSVRTLKPCVIHNLPIQFATTNKTLGFVFAYTSDTSIESLLDNFYELNQNVDLDSQISMICILDKGLILRTYNSKIGQICLAPESKTTLGFCKNPLETNLYLFYLFLMSALNSMMNLPPDLMTYAEKQGALNIKTMYPNKYISKDGTYGLGGITLDGTFLEQMPELNQRFAKYQSGHMNKEEVFQFYIDDMPAFIASLNKYIPNESSKFITPTMLNEETMNTLKFILKKNRDGDIVSEDEKALMEKTSEKLYAEYMSLFNSH